MNSNPTHHFLILGNQLFDPTFVMRALSLTSLESVHVFMREDLELCTYYKFHKQKILFFLSAMQNYARELNDWGAEVHFEKLDPGAGASYEKALGEYLKKTKVKKLFLFEIEDKFFEKRIFALLKKLGVDVEVFDSPMFLSSREDFKEYLANQKRPFMKTFYERQRKRLKILVTKGFQPEGGQWSFDVENRKPLPKDVSPPALPKFKMDVLTKKLAESVEQNFSSHPGTLDNFIYPTDRNQARLWLRDFVKNRLEDFGTYEDAMSEESDFVFHSVLTPFLNCGLLTPAEVVQCCLEQHKKSPVRLASLEGFIRQVIGWREFIRGVYQNFSERQETLNFFGAKRKLKPVWYNGTTGILPLDHVIKKTIKYAYAHHIERLMVVGSLMTLLEVDPQEAHRWFMEMFLDSSDWVMGPNVYGMALFSDGGIFATKPYICGSNYYKKMGTFKKGAWCDEVDALYWTFVGKNKDKFKRNPRISMMIKTYEKMDESKKKSMQVLADQVRNRLTEN